MIAVVQAMNVHVPVDLLEFIVKLVNIEKNVSIFASPASFGTQKTPKRFQRIKKYLKLHKKDVSISPK